MNFTFESGQIHIEGEHQRQSHADVTVNGDLVYADVTVIFTMNPWCLHVVDQTRIDTYLLATHVGTSMTSLDDGRVRWEGRNASTDSVITVTFTPDPRLRLVDPPARPESGCVDALVYDNVAQVYPARGDGAAGFAAGDLLVYGNTGLRLFHPHGTWTSYTVEPADTPGQYRVTVVPAASAKVIT